MRARPRARARVLGLALAGAAGLAPAAAPGVESIQVLGLFKDRAVALIDGERRTLVRGEPSPEGVVLIEADSEAAVLEFDGHRRTFGLGRRITTVYRPPAAQPALTIAPSGAGMYRVPGSINGFPVRFLVDTGATLVAMNRGTARRLGIDYLVDGRPGRARTANGIVDTYQVVLERVRVGGIELRDVAASVVDGDFPEETLLGNSFLNRLEMQRKGALLELRMRP